MFQFPSSGKGCSKDVWFFTLTEQQYKGFNSLQAGRGVQSKKMKLFVALTLVSIPFKREGVFKDTLFGTETRQSRPFVSIPFKREGVFKENRVFTFLGTLLFWFQFPSSGKGCSKIFSNIRSMTKRIILGFNSLQAGRGVQRLTRLCPTRDDVVWLFQFPSSGKGCSKRTCP